LLYESPNAKQWAESVQVDAAILVILDQVKNRTISRNVIRQMIDGTSVRLTLGLPHEYYQKSRRCCRLHTRYRVDRYIRAIAGGSLVHIRSQLRS